MHQKKAFLASTDSKQFGSPIFRKDVCYKSTEYKPRKVSGKSIKKMGAVEEDWNSLLYLARQIKAEKECDFSI